MANIGKPMRILRRFKRRQTGPRPPATPMKGAGPAADSDDDDIPPPPPPLTEPLAGADPTLNEASQKDAAWVFNDFLDAVEDKDVDGVNILLDSIDSKSELVNKADPDGFTALLYACTYSRGEALVQVLLDNKANVNYVAPDGSTALDCASQDNLLRTVDVLLQHPDINVNAGRCSALFMASQEGYLDLVNKLLRAKCRVDRRAYNGVTPIVMAIVQGFPDVALALLRAKASATDPSAAQGGRTPLLMAVERNDKQIVNYLVQAKANIHRNQRVVHGFVPMNKDAPKSRCTATHSRMYTPILRAAGLGLTEMVEYLHDLGADLGGLDEDGQTINQLILAHSRKQLEALDKAAAAETTEASSTPTSQPPLPDTDSNSPSVSGYMDKGEGFKKRNRFFILSKTRLVFFKSKDDYVKCCGGGGCSMFDLYDGDITLPEVVGSIPLKGSSVENVEEMEHRFQVFSYKNGAPKIYKFHCGDASTATEWVKEIQNHINQLRAEMASDDVVLAP